jgi:2-keto-3-deoxy-L-rhamnonate aldolase RhmA
MKKRLSTDTSGVLLGSWITLGHPAVAEIMADAGFDWLAIDMEHSAIGVREAEDLIRVIDLKGASPLVRLTSNDPDLIKRVMDSGAHGIIVPMVNTSSDARKAVAAANYPPRGTRGVGLARAQRYGSDFEGYRRWLDTGPFIVVQIEHIDAVSNLEEILSVPGVSAFIVGPYDLSGSLGFPGAFDHPRFIEAMHRIRQVASRIGAMSGIHIIEPDKFALGKCIEQGYRFIAYSLDIRMLDCASRGAVVEAKG